MTNDQTVTQALEPCPNPWCSDSKPVVMQGGFRGRKTVVECVTCQMRGPIVDDIAGGQRAAITAWNTRTAHSGEGRSNGAGEADPSKMSVEMAELFGLVCKLNRLKTERDDLMRTDGGFSVIERAADMMDEIVDAMPALQSAFSKVCEREHQLLAALSAPQGEVERLARNVRGWLEWYRLTEDGDDCDYLNGNAWADAEALASTSMGLLAALAQPEAGGER